jgi:tetratricopeptide (TPR) repeat protein
MHAREISQTFSENGPYPLAHRWQLFFAEKPAGHQCVVWTRQFCHDMLQYITLLLVGDYLQGPQSLTLLPHYHMTDWADLLGKLVALKRESRVSSAIAQAHHNWTTTRVTLAGQEIPLWHVLLTEGVTYGMWDEDACVQIMLALSEGARPIYASDWSLSLASDEVGKTLCSLQGANPLRNVSAYSFTSAKVGDLVAATHGHVTLTTGDSTLDLFPFFLLDMAGTFWMWDGEISKDEVMFHSEFRRLLWPKATLPGYTETALRTSFPSMQDNSGRARYAVYQTERYIARQEQSGRYQPLAYLPNEELVGELHNFILSKSASAALICSRRGTGKLNLVCHMAQEWQRRGHIVIIQEAQDVGAKTFRNVIPLVPIAEGKRCILILPKIEEHPNLTNCFAYLQEFLQIYGHPQSGLRLLMVCDYDILQLLLKNDPLLLPLRFLYRPQLQVCKEMPFALTTAPLNQQTITAIYQQYQKIPDSKLANNFGDLHESLQERLRQQPVWLRLLTAGARGWRIPPQIRPDEILNNYLGQHLWERPLLGQAVEALLPLLSENYPIPVAYAEAYLTNANLPQTVWHEGVRHGIFEYRRTAEGKESLAFALPIVKDFLWAKSLQKSGKLGDLLKNNDYLHHYHTMIWTAVMCALKDHLGEMLTLLQELSNGPQIVAEALCLLEELRPTTADTQDTWDNKTARLCQFLLQQKESLFLQQKELALNALLEFFARLSQRKMCNIYYRVEELVIKHFPQLTFEQQLKFWETVARHYAAVDMAKTREAASKWWHAILQIDNPIDRRHVAYTLAQVYEDSNMPEAALEMGKLALRIAQDYGFFEEAYNSIRWLAAFHVRQNKLTAAQDYYEQMLPLADKLENRTGKLFIWQRQALIHNQTGNLTAAIDCYDKMRELAAVFADRLAPMQAYEAEAICFEVGEQYQEAIKMCQKAYQLATELALYDRARVLARRMAELNKKLAVTT